VGVRSMVREISEGKMDRKAYPISGCSVNVIGRSQFLGQRTAKLFQHLNRLR
jgi:hypothetical protein